MNAHENTAPATAGATPSYEQRMLSAAPLLHDSIMNLPCNEPNLSGLRAVGGYRVGHRDARHAAAELANGADAELQRLRAENEKLRADAKRAAARDAMFCNTIERGYLAMQAAWLEAEITTPANGIVWIHNTLWGPGLLPDADEARALGGAQAWFDRESAKLDAADAAREAATTTAQEVAHG